HDGADLGIEKGSDQLTKKRLTGNVIRIEDEHDLGIDPGHGILQGGRLARFTGGAVKWLDERILVGELVYDFTRSVGRAIVDRDNGELLSRIVRLQQGFHDVGDDRLFIMCGDQNSNGRPDSTLQVHIRMALLAEETVQREEIVTERVDTNNQYDGPEQNH